MFRVTLNFTAASVGFFQDSSQLVPYLGLLFLSVLYRDMRNLNCLDEQHQYV